VAKLRAMNQIVNGALVPLLRDTAALAGQLARVTLPDHPDRFRAEFSVVSERLWAGTEGLTLTGMRTMFLLADQRIAEYTVQVIGGRTDFARRPELLDSEMPTASGALAAEMGMVLERVRKHAAQARHGRTLSDRVWLNDRGTRVAVQNLIDDAIRNGEGPAVLARRVKRYLQPDVPGGASYAAMRLARTELLAAWDARERQLLRAAGIYAGVQWMLSPTHTGVDVCDELAAGGPYPLDAIPPRPHPHDMCWIEPVIDDEALAALGDG
jgi:hypothetical protein